MDKLPLLLGLALLIPAGACKDKVVVADCNALVSTIKDMQDSTGPTKWSDGRAKLAALELHDPKIASYRDDYVSMLDNRTRILSFASSSDEALRTKAQRDAVQLDAREQYTVSQINDYCR